jgi:hypothetical protein
VIEWLVERKLFSLELERQTFLPRYAFDEHWLPIDAIAQVIHVFGQTYSNIDVAAWFESPSKFLDNARPRELLTKDAALIVACARDCFSNEHYAG